MPYGLKSLWNTGSSITYSCAEIRESSSIEESASFLVRWAAELFGGWASWMRHNLPGVKVSYKQSTLRLVNKIKEMVDDGSITNIKDGWERITDMLRATYRCSSVKQVLDTMEKLEEHDPVIKILRIKPRFGPLKNNLNDVTINFDWEG